MAVVMHGKVKSGALELPRPLEIPEGTDVVVSIEPVGRVEPTQDTAEGDFLSLPFFGLWADRDEMRDSTAWVRKVRQAWQERSTP